MSERAVFNEWIEHYEKHDVKIDQLQRAFMWQAWQASAKRVGYKLVPVNYECVWCGCTELGGWADEAMIGICDD